MKMLFLALVLSAQLFAAVSAPGQYTGKGGGVSEGVEILSTGEADNLVLTSDGAGGAEWGSVAGTGDVVGPASSVDGEIVLFDSTTGKAIKRASGTGVCKATSGVASFATLVNADVSASAAIAYSKLAALTDGNILVGNGSNVAVSVNPSGDVDISNAGVFSISSGVIVNADVNASAAIALSKLSLTGLVEDLHGLIATVADTTYVLVQKNRVARQVTKIALDCGSGSVTAKLQIDGADITTCTSISVTTTESDTTCNTGSTNDLALDTTLTLVTSSNSSCTNLGWSIETTRD